MKEMTLFDSVVKLVLHDTTVELGYVAAERCKQAIDLVNYPS